MESRYPMNHRRLRASTQMRELTATVVLDYKKFIQPLFVDENLAERKIITGLKDVYSETIESVLDTIAEDLKKGVSKFLIFPVPANKFDKDFDFKFAAQVIEKIKSTFGQTVWLASDLCLCSYTTHGHCGILNYDHSQLLNEKTVMILSEYALALAHAGIDCIAPSDMTDGRIGAIRQTLDGHRYDHISIMSYSAKFSSQYYGPFRDACHSAPNTTGLQNRKTYQISPLNLHDAVQTSIRDSVEGADILMVKPASLYTDVISAIKSQVNKPLAAYHVSGEYASIEYMVSAGMLQREAAHLEAWTALVRSGADIIISYASRHANDWIGRMEA